MSTTGPPTALADALRDRYRFDRELGRGGIVHLAHDLRHDRSVALKVLHPELAQTLGPERFQREIRLAARLQHIARPHSPVSVAYRSDEKSLGFFCRAP